MVDTQTRRSRPIDRDYELYTLMGGLTQHHPHSFDPDPRTGELLTPPVIAREFPEAALASYERWKAAVAAGDEDALATYRLLLPGRPREIDLEFLVDRIDNPDPEVEGAVVKAIFGHTAKYIHPILRDGFMRRRTETAHALGRLRTRLAGNCPAPSDAGRVRRVAAATVTDDMLRAWCSDVEGRPFLECRVESCVVVTHARDRTCTFTHVQIPAGEQHIPCGMTMSRGGARHAYASKAAVWCLYVLGDLENAFNLPPDRIP